MSRDSSSAGRRTFFGRIAAAFTGGALLGASRPAEATPGYDYYAGEIKLFAGDFAPSGWLFCEGQLLSIGQYETLWNLIGTTYGGDGQTYFALPDLRGRAPVHQGNTFVMGQQGGLESVTLASTNLPVHTHAAMAGAALGTSDDPTGRAPAKNAAGAPRYAPAPDISLATASLTTAGGSAAHPNMQPWMGIRYIIATDGIFPSHQ